MPQYTVLRTTVYEGSDWQSQLCDAWHELAADSSDMTPFQTWEWQSTWHRVLGSRKQPHVWTLWEGKDLIGLYPMVRTGAPWKVLRPMGCGPSDYLHPIARRRCEGRVAESLTGYLSGMKKCQIVDIQQLRENKEFAVTQSKACEPAGAVLDQATCLVVDLPPNYDVYVSGLSKSLRYDVRRLDRQAAAGEKLQIDTATSATVGKGMDALFECHHRRWRKRGLPGAFLGKRLQRFHREWAQIAADNDWMRLSVLRFEGEVIGAIYAMSLDGTCYFYQSGFDPGKSSISPGTLLVAHTIRQAISEGRSQFDLMRGDEPYKRRWKPQRTYRNLRLLSPSDSLRGRVAKSWMGTEFRIESNLRARLEGKGLVG